MKIKSKVSATMLDEAWRKFFASEGDEEALLTLSMYNDLLHQATPEDRLASNFIHRARLRILTPR